MGARKSNETLRNQQRMCLGWDEHRKVGALIHGRRAEVYHHHAWGLPAAAALRLLIRSPPLCFRHPLTNHYSAYRELSFLPLWWVPSSNYPSDSTRR